jgi:hypothetical protein
MPLCPQITITPVTVTSTNMTQTSVIAANAPATTEQLTTVSDSVAAALAAAAAADAAAAAAQADADAAQASAATAQADATEALADAATAYTAAIGSLQPSANTIVNASNQMTAINSTGITVYSGASATSGARVVLNSAGLAGFNSGGTATFSVSASTGAAVFSGSVTGATITGGTLNIGGNAIIDASGLLTATGATITGAVNATSGYFGSASNGYSISSTGLVGVGTGVIIGGQIQTSSGGTSVGLIGSTNSLSFKNGGSYVGHLVPLSSNGILMHYGAAADGSGGTFPQVYVSGSNALLAASNALYVSVNSGGLGIQIQGNTALNSQTTYPGIATGSGSTMVVVTTGSRMAYTTSSERFKQDIQYISTSGWLEKVLAMKPITYKTSEDFTTEGEPNETQIGFLAEDIADIGGGIETAVVLDPLGDPFSLSYDRLTVFLMLAIKELKAEIELLKGA